MEKLCVQHFSVKPHLKKLNIAQQDPHGKIHKESGFPAKFIELQVCHTICPLWFFSEVAPNPHSHQSVPWRLETEPLHFLVQSLVFFSPCISKPPGVMFVQLYIMMQTPADLPGNIGKGWSGRTLNLFRDDFASQILIPSQFMIRNWQKEWVVVHYRL